MNRLKNTLNIILAGFIVVWLGSSFLLSIAHLLGDLIPDITSGLLTVSSISVIIGGSIAGYNKLSGMSFKKKIKQVKQQTTSKLKKEKELELEEDCGCKKS
ncbi:MAG: hypothetical protein GTO02_20600 [Candidatus Dadabacteria bacterium]|nr:hypothetical protein [Candidatus Dadabacteria bacterium]